MIRLLVCGTRSYADREAVEIALDEIIDYHGIPEVVIAGDAKGPDAFAIEFADQHHLKRERFEADWALGKQGGPLRNQRMIDEGKPNQAVAFWNGRSRGTLDMIARCAKAGVPVIVVPTK